MAENAGGGEKFTEKQIQWLVLSSLLICFLVLGIRAASLRSLWFDEIATFNVATRPSMRALFRALPYDGNPPLYFLLARAFLALPIKTELALRLPSVISWVCGSILAYRFVRRTATHSFALIAMCLFLGATMEGTAALDARPYALLLCSTALAICAWQMAAFGSARRFGHLLLAVSTNVAVLSHQYGVIYVSGAVAVGECIRMLRDRRFHLSVLAAMLLGWFPLAFTVPSTLRAQAPILAAIRLCPVYRHHPSLDHLLIYERTLPTFVDLIFILCAVIVVILRRNRKDGTQLHTGRPGLEDIGVSAFLALLLPIMLIVTKLGTGYFVERYAVGSALGVALLVPLLLACLANSRAVRPVTEFIILYSITIGILTFVFIRPHTSPELGGLQSDPLFRSAPLKEQIVIGDPFSYVPTWWYSKATDRKRIHYLSDLKFALTQNDPVPENSLALEQPFGAPPIESYKAFTEAHEEFILFCASDWRPVWIKDRLLHEGWKLTLIGTENEMELFAVKAPKLAEAAGVHGVSN